MLNLNKTCKVSLKCRKYKVLGNNLATFLELQKSFQSEQILFSSIFNIFEFSGRWDFGEKKITMKFKFPTIQQPEPESDNIVLPDVWMLMVQMEVSLKHFFCQSDWYFIFYSLQASFRCNITAGLFNFNFLKSWKLISSGFNSFAECKGLYFSNTDGWVIYFVFLSLQPTQAERLETPLT